MSTKLFSLLGAGAVVVGSLGQCLYNVDPGEAAIIFDKLVGVKTTVYGEGTHLKVPFIQDPVIFDIRSRPRSVPVTTGSKDLQTVNLTLRILFHPDPTLLPSIYTNVGLDYDERILPSIVDEVLKSVVAKYDASELITQRDAVSNSVADELTARGQTFGIYLDDISITHLTFGGDFTRAVESKQVAQQEAERSRYYVEKAEFEKKAAITSAEGDAEAAKMLSEAFNKVGDALIELRKMEAAEEIASHLATSRNVVYLPKDKGMLLNLPAN